MPPLSLSAVLDNLQIHVPEAEAWWVALSGGADSTALLHCLAGGRPGLPVSLGAVHVNHHLQAPADDWAAQCRALCGQLGLEYVVLDAEVGVGTGESPEAAAREARYRVLRDWLAPGHALLTAHHEDDQAETLLLQLLRGGGPRGLAAMPPAGRFGRGWLVRPLLETGRAALVRYCEQQGLAWIEDPTNASPHYDRNFLRQEILPRLRQRWPTASRVLHRAARHQAEAASLLDHLAVNDLLQMTDSAGTLGVRILAQLTSARRRNLLRYWLHSLGLPVPSEAVMAQIETQALYARADATPVVRWPGAEVRRYRQQLYAMTPVPAPDRQLVLKWDGRSMPIPALCGRLEVTEAAGQGLSPRVWQAHRASLRLRRGGERLAPVNRGHHHSIKHLFQEIGMPPWERDLVPLVHADEELVAVPGQWIAEGWQAGEGEIGALLTWRRAALSCPDGD